ncbi:MAG: hypothetical protein CMO01_16850, partial [Thalassobius sp.]|nr:hypothetical protein [Thalassovita sp.]
SIKVGKGNNGIGLFEDIDWGNTSKFLKIEIDPDGGSNYQFVGSIELLSVPYALYAGTISNTNDDDADPENELITNAVLNGSVLEILEAGTTTYIDLSGLLNLVTDNDATNELQDISLEGTMLSISNGTTIDLASILDGNEDADADPQNELQTLNLNGNKLSISDGNEVILPTSSTSGGAYYYYDADLDTYGDPTRPVWVPADVAAPQGFVSQTGDCDDANASINPGATDVADGIDNNCDGQTDELDTDGDGIADYLDNCPLAANLNQADFDGDGIGDLCDSDDDNDGDPDNTDCEPLNASISHNRGEILNGIDDNCDGFIDDICYENDGNDDCAQAKYLGSLSDTGSSKFQSGTITTKRTTIITDLAEEDWYTFQAIDETQFIDRFNVKIQIDNINYRMDIYKNSCTNKIASSVSYFSDDGGLGDDSAIYYIRVYLPTQVNSSLCQDYLISITNGL